MKQIIPPYEAVLRTLGKAKSSTEQCRMMTCCVPLETEDGVLLFHVLTRELLLLTPEEYAAAETLPYLHDHWFFVPATTNDTELISFVRWVLLNYKKDKREKNINGYTIFTTTDCNARCYYCFEHGCSHVSMTPETAHKVSAYIKDHCSEKPVKLTWFGGEPLVNDCVIDLICKDLQEAGISYESKIVTNGYLFDKDMIPRAKDLWNLRRVQISLDGTEQVYNYSKDYIYPEGNPYEIVLTNLGNLLDAGIPVQIRLNISPINMEDLLDLVQELSVRYRGKKGLVIYSYPLYDFSPNANEKESRKALYAAQAKLEEAILSVGFSKRNIRPLRRELKVNHCMADGGHSVTVLPEGQLGLCEHHVEDEFIGHIDHPGFDETVLQRWRERGPEIPECQTCFYYPECTHLRLCADSIACCEHRRTMCLQEMEHSMLYELQQWKASQSET